MRLHTRFERSKRAVMRLSWEGAAEVSRGHPAAAAAQKRGRQGQQPRHRVASRRRASCGPGDPWRPPAPPGPAAPVAPAQPATVLHPRAVPTRAGTLRKQPRLCPPQTCRGCRSRSQATPSARPGTEPETDGDSVVNSAEASCQPCRNGSRSSMHSLVRSTSR